MRVEQTLEESARRFPHKEALVADGECATYARLDADANRLARGLRSRGVARGDRVVLFLHNSLQAAVAIFATLKAGAILSVVNPSTKADKLAYLLDKYQATALVTQQRLWEVAQEALRRSQSVAFSILADDAHECTADALPWAQALAEEGREPPGGAGLDIDLAMIVTTSGSTGLPKGVMMTHQNIDAAAASITSYLENGPQDRIVSVLPLAFDYGLYQLIMSVRLGATLILEPSFAYPGQVLQILREERATGFPIVPTMAAVLLQMRSLAPGMFPHLRYITSTAAALPPAHIERLQGLFPGTRLYSMYGLTECKRCTYLPPEELSRRPGSVGIAIPGTEAFVVDDEGRPVPSGVVGELVIRGAHVFKGYWNDPQETEHMLKPGPYPWEKVLYTGDLFRADEDGYLYFVGRRDDIIKTAGEKVSPKEVENVLYAIPGVREAAVVGVAHPILGMALKAILVAEPGVLSEREVIAHCAARLESFMVPSSVEFRSSLPQTATGKIRRSTLQAEALQRALSVPT